MTWIYHSLFNMSLSCGYFPHYFVVTHYPTMNNRLGPVYFHFKTQIPESEIAKVKQ